jgi:hypothetical protein
MWEIDCGDVRIEARRSRRQLQKSKKEMMAAWICVAGKEVVKGIRF